ncbi:RrF2 family transcriptional regulator [Chitinivibrio alkaliphilus]|uniref:Transcriptional regulator, BadM/Rrf2 family n=1 Tax=Chitinivibrio alkaliphilus ACht1 TaxID=1313304 RepID=U7D7K1_9BACT|nr:Rrf2 family transcriptional regulator [Chitinivibrio alkaliphilus]ERP31077.1 transcriptional regulator, BadM/Rrf2 family [Chitinivibrio alkaliphilus ACht1]
MRLSTKTRYSLRILIQLATVGPNSPALKGKVMAQEQEISEPYLEQIMIPLKSSGLVSTIRGCNGGYVLNADPEKITVLDIIELFDGPVQFSSCKEENDGSPCRRIANCPSTAVWAHLSKVLREEAQKITVKELADKCTTSEFQEYVI